LSKDFARTRKEDEVGQKEKDAWQAEMQQLHEEAARTSWQSRSTVRRGNGRLLLLLLLLPGRQSSAPKSAVWTFEQELVARVVISDFVASAVYGFAGFCYFSAFFTPPGTWVFHILKPHLAAGFDSI